MSEIQVQRPKVKRIPQKIPKKSHDKMSVIYSKPSTTNYNTPTELSTDYNISMEMSTEAKMIYEEKRAQLKKMKESADSLTKEVRDLQEKEKNLTQELEDLRTKRQKVNSQAEEPITKLKQQKMDLQEQVESLDITISNLLSEQTTLFSQNTASINQLKDLKQKISIFSHCDQIKELYEYYLEEQHQSETAIAHLNEQSKEMDSQLESLQPKLNKLTIETKKLADSNPELVKKADSLRQELRLLRAKRADLEAQNDLKAKAVDPETASQQLNNEQWSSQNEVEKQKAIIESIYKEELAKLEQLRIEDGKTFETMQAIEKEVADLREQVAIAEREWNEETQIYQHEENELAQSLLGTK